MMNAARLKLSGILRNAHPTLCYQWACPIKCNPNPSSGSFNCKLGAMVNFSLSHSNRHPAKSVSLPFCLETNVNCQFETIKNCHLFHCSKDSNVNYHLIHYAEDHKMNCPPFAEDNNHYCISQTRLSRNRLSPRMSFEHRDFLVVQSALKTSSRHLSMQARSPLLKGKCMHTVQTRSFFEGLYTSLSQSTPVQSTQGLLLELHQWSGLPWWAIICLSTLAIRTLVVLPLAIHQMQVISRLAKIDAEIRGLLPELNKEVAIAKRIYGFDEMHARRVFRKQLGSIRQKYILRDNCHPFKAVLLVLFQMPLWVCLSISLRNLTFMAQRGSSGALDLKSEGLLWFPDLTVPDPILLPLILLAVNLALTHVHVLRQKGKGNRLQKILINGSRVISVAVAVAATINPSSVSFYWVCSSTFGLGQNLLLASPKVKSALGIPRLTTETATPLKDNDTKNKR